MRILIFGGTGQLGTSLAKKMKLKNYKYQTVSRKVNNMSTTELADEVKATELIAKFEATHVINLIALTNVDQCEKDKELAKIVNEEISEKIAKGCHNNRARLVHISTDQVYSQQKSNKEHEYKPVNQYGWTKLRGENKCLKSNENTLVLRTNFIGIDERSTPKSLVNWIKGVIEAREELKVFKDVRFNPLNTRVLCEIIEKALSEKQTGIYNVGSRGETTKYELALRIRDALDVTYSGIRAISVDEMRLEAIRPKCMLMDVSKFEKDFNIKLPSIMETLQHTVDEF